MSNFAPVPGLCGGERAQRTLDDPEGLAYMDNGTILIGDEHRNVRYLSTYAPGAQVRKNSMPTYTFGPCDGLCRWPRFSADRSSHLFTR